MEWVYFVLMILVLAGLWLVLNRMDRRAKSKYREEAYQILDSEEASAERIRKVIKGLLLYGGRIRKDKEFMELRQKLSRRLDDMERTRA